MMQALLRSKFGDCKFASVSNCKGSYENTAEVAFYVFDPPSELNEPVKIVNENEDHQLKISNPHKSDVCVVKTDKCLFTSDISKCDCLLFNDNKFYLVEIKSSGMGTRGAQRHRAVEQLGATINTLRAADININMFDAKAVICFKSLSAYPVRASLLSQRAVFQEEYSVSLEEGNAIEF